MQKIFKGDAKEGRKEKNPTKESIIDRNTKVK